MYIYAMINVSAKKVFSSRAPLELSHHEIIKLMVLELVIRYMLWKISGT